MDDDEEIPTSKHHFAEPPEDFTVDKEDEDVDEDEDPVFANDVEDPFIKDASGKSYNTRQSKSRY